MERIESKQFRDYSQQIDDITFFQGDTITIPFQFIDFDGDVVTLRKTSKSQTYVKWLLCPFGQYQNPLIELKSDSVTLQVEMFILMMKQILFMYILMIPKLKN